MVRTRVGYAGGTKDEPTYRDLGDHSEAIQIDFDPAQISYEELLEIFWQDHNPTGGNWSTQYAAFVFTHDEEQARLARESRDRIAKSSTQRVTTAIRPAAKFWRAEDYHQKYRLRQSHALHDKLAAFYPDDRALVDSTAAARLNGLLSGHGRSDSVKAELRELAIPQPILAMVPG